MVQIAGRRNRHRVRDIFISLSHDNIRVRLAEGIRRHNARDASGRDAVAGVVGSNHPCNFRAGNEIAGEQKFERRQQAGENKMVTV